MTWTVRRFLVAFLPVFCALAMSAQTSRNIEFVSVTANDPDLEHNDLELCGFLGKQTGARIQCEDRGFDTYVAGIERVTALSKSGRSFIARLTPYALVAAELQGARFDILGSYNGRNRQGDEDQIYHAYFVVRRADFPGLKEPPDLQALTRYLRTPRSVRRFAYHDQYSTSSYFVPLLFFKDQEILDTENGQVTGDIHPIAIVVPDKGDKAVTSVTKVLDQRADIAAVWDGTLTKFADKQKERLWIVRIDRVLPNDLLVSSRGLDVHDELQKAIGAFGPACDSGQVTFQDDVVCWEEIGAVVGNALTRLRQDAAPKPPRMTVRITAKDNAPALQKYVDAAEHAVRYAGTEFIPSDESMKGETPDMDWTIELLREGAILITSKLHKVDKGEQAFRISFADENDLPPRIASRVHSELNRIRYIWPYQEKPTVLRDVNFSLEGGTAVIVQKVTLNSIKKGTFTPGTIHDTFTIKATDMSTFTLDDAGSPGVLKLDPLSNVAYRVVLAPPAKTPLFFTVVTVAVMILSVGALMAALYDVYRILRARAQTVRTGGTVPAAIAPPVPAE
ncbi:MAG: PhnD/SsuA/transferrin family substrate-binding protein [Thermoanaerobaculia bacterium]